jgi:hypothetical protein
MPYNSMAMTFSKGNTTCSGLSPRVYVGDKEAPDKESPGTYQPLLAVVWFL